MANFVIVGSGAAGISAASAIRKEDRKSKVHVITNDPFGYYSRPGLAYLLAGEVPQSQLYPFNQKFFNEEDIKIVNQPVQSILPERHQIKTGDGSFLAYDKLLLATGARASLPQLPGIELEGVVKLDNMVDAEQILKIARKARSAVVIGGGITALEIVEGLATQDIEVHYFLRGERYWSSVLDEVESKIVENILLHDGIKIHYFTELEEILGEKGKVSGVIARQKQNQVQIDCQMVAFAIGIKPRVDLAVQVGLKTQRGVLVDANLHTSQADIFAAGDVAQIFDPLSGEYLLDSLWRPAIEQGWIAGLNMAGGNYAYEKKYPFNVTRLGGLITTIIGRVGKAVIEGNKQNGDSDVKGIMRGDSEVWRQHSLGIIAQTYQETNRIRLYITTTHITGAVVMGDQTLSRPLQVLIREQVDISSIRETMLLPHCSLVDTLKGFWEEYEGKNA
jgi:NAD(P)H-nitrite reductase large subunit